MANASSSTDKGDMDIIQFKCHGYGHVRIARKYATKDILSDLFQLEDIVIVDDNGDEVLSTSGKLSGISSQISYTVASENDLDIDSPHEHVHIDHRRMHFMQKARVELIRDFYKPLHPHLYTLSESFFVPSFLEAVKKYRVSHDASDVLSVLKKETYTGIYSFEIFNLQFCKELLEEVENFEHAGLPISRPNSMNNYGVILDEIGFEPFFNSLTEYILPFSTVLYPNDGGSSLDSHHAFIVQYKLTEDLDLGFHYDMSEVTLNLCLGKHFIGGSLYFRGLLKDKSTHDEEFDFRHTVGKSILHVGKHRHGANSIKQGERYNLIVWFRSSTYVSTLPCACGHNHDAEEQEQEQQVDHEHVHDHSHTHSHEHGEEHGAHDHHDHDHDHDHDHHTHDHHDHDNHTHDHHDHDHHTRAHT